MLVGSRIGPFEVEKILGSGAMGTVYLAAYHRDDKVTPVALKVVSMGLLENDGALARFEREGAILHQLKHPNIVRLYAAGKFKKTNTPFIAMEFIDGEALDAVLKRRGRFSWEEVVAFGKQLCAALQYAHEKSIIHRDLKPSNLMLAKDGVLKLTDFGIAKDQDLTALTGHNSTIGTAAYMSPEQCKGDRSLSNKSDLYSLGIVFFELLTGRKMYTADSTVDMFLKHVNDKPPRPGKLVSELPAKFETLVLQLVEKDRANRPVDAAWVGRMLAEIEEDAYARRSAGLDAATARKGDLGAGRTAEADDADREAARALKGKKRKVKKPVEAPPLYQRPAVKAAALLIALGGVAAAAYFAFKPARPEELLAAIEKAPAGDREAAVDKYLDAYGERADDATENVRTLYRDEKARKWDDVLTRRFGRKLQQPPEGDDAEAYTRALSAMEAERTGDLRRAAGLWATVRDRFPEEAKLRPPIPDAEAARKAVWGWVADRRVRDIERVGSEPRRLRDQIARDRITETISTRVYGAADPEGLAVRALRLEDFGDRPKARAAWETLATQAEKSPDGRVWFLLASQQRKQLPAEKEDEALARRVQLVRDKVGTVRSFAAGGDSTARDKRRDARNTARDVIDLYDDEPADALHAAVDEARRLLAALSR